MRKLLAALAVAAALGSPAASWAADDQTIAKCIYNASPPTAEDGQPIAQQCDINGNVKLHGDLTLAPAVDQGTAAAASGAWPVAPAAATAGGASNYHKIAAASDNHAVVKNGIATAYDIDCTSSTDGTATDYVRLYDAGTGFNGCNSATNVVWGVVCPAAATAAGIGAVFTKSFPVGRAFANGISICITGNGDAPADTSTTNAHTTTVVNLGYK